MHSIMQRSLFYSNMERNCNSTNLLSVHIQQHYCWHFSYIFIYLLIIMISKAFLFTLITLHVFPLLPNQKLQIVRLEVCGWASGHFSGGNEGRYGGQESSTHCVSRQSTSQQRKQLYLFDNMCAANIHSTTEERNRPQVARMTRAFLCHHLWLKVIEVTHIWAVLGSELKHKFSFLCISIPWWLMAKIWLIPSQMKKNGNFLARHGCPTCPSLFTVPRSCWHFCCLHFSSLFDCRGGSCARVVKLMEMLP